MNAILNQQADTMQAAQAAGQTVSQGIGAYADMKRNDAADAYAAAYKRGDSDGMAAAAADYNNWKEGGDSRAELHVAGGALIGGLGGGGAFSTIGGAAGAGMASKMAGSLNDISKGVASATGSDLIGNLAANIAAGVGGAVVGGTAGSAMASNVHLYNQSIDDERLLTGEPGKKSPTLFSLAMQGIANGLNAIIGVSGGVPPAASPGAVLVNGSGQVLAARTASSANTITGSDNGYGTLSKSPNPEMRDNANASGTYVDPLSNEVKQADGRLAADHILPQNWIKQQEGFDLLTPAQQSELLNDPMNTQGLPSSFNSSKGAKMPGDWTTYKGQPLDPAYIEASAAQAAALKNYITNRINTMLGK